MKQLEFKMDHIDMMSEMGEMESLRLQMAMDRMSKMMSKYKRTEIKIKPTSRLVVLSKRYSTNAT